VQFRFVCWFSFAAPQVLQPISDFVLQALYRSTNKILNNNRNPEQDF
jgi:uncharacterized protein (DUF1778 family)